MENSEVKQNQEEENQVKQSFPNVNFISMVTVVNMLIEKGVCTAEELLNAEKKRRQHIDDLDKINLVQITRPQEAGGKDSHKKHKVSWLKRKMGKKRWSRRLAKALFGWEYKKVILDKGGKLV